MKEHSRLFRRFPKRDILAARIFSLPQQHSLMTSNDFGGEQPVNYEQKCPCILVLDVSSSMQGASIGQLNAGLAQFHQEVTSSKDPVTPNRLEIGIVTFSSTVQVVQTPALVYDFSMPTLTTSGSTKLVDGVRAGIRLAEERKAWYKSTQQDYYRPYIILITDGAPDNDQDVDGLAAEIRAAYDAKRYAFWAFGVEGADMSLLGRIAHPSNPPMSFASANFGEFFQWLSKSFGKITASKEGMKLDLTPERPSLFQHTV